MKKNILLCDDDKELNQDIKDDLELEFDNIIVFPAYNRSEALDAISKRYFTVAIIDLNLEGATTPVDWKKTGGVEVINAISLQNYGTKTIIVSGNPETELSFELSKKYDVSKYIHKNQGFSVKKILDSVRSLLTSDDHLVERIDHKLEKFSGKSGFDRDIFEIDFISNLNVHNGTKGLESIAIKALNEFYPYKHLSKYGFILDKENKSLTGKIWSYKRGNAYDLFIYHNKISTINDQQEEKSGNDEIHALGNDIFIRSRIAESLITGS
jgi:DNA-binding NarL/FixJ family response regulator